MKSYRFLPFLLSAGALAAGALNLNAATSGVVGAVSFDIPVGATIVSFPFLKPVEFQGPVDSVTSADVDLATTLPTLTGAAYVHVLSGADEGMVYDIASVAGSVVTLAQVPAGLASTDVVAIRYHMTVSDLGTPPDFTSLLLLGSGGTPITNDFLFGSWSDPNMVIRPGEGAVINNNPAWTVTLYGSVSEDDVIFSASSGSQIVGNIDPVNGSADVLASIEANAPDFTSLLELNAGGAPVTYDLLFGSWTPDPLNIDVSGFKTFVINTGSGVDIVNAGLIISP
jgi:hypothetical protein